MLTRLEKSLLCFTEIIETVRETYFGRLEYNQPKEIKVKEINLEEEYAKNKYFPEL